MPEIFFNLRHVFLFALYLNSSILIDTSYFLLSLEIGRGEKTVLFYKNLLNIIQIIEKMPIKFKRKTTAEKTLFSIKFDVSYK